MHRFRFPIGLLVIVTAAALMASPATAVATLGVPPNVDVSQRAGNESEEAIAVNPTNPQNIVIVSNIAEGVAGLFAAVSFDGGQTWTRRIIGDNDNLGDACCDASLSFDEFGNLFLTYLYNVENQVPVALSTDGGRTFSLIATIAKPASVAGRAVAGRRGG